jgi:maltose alpha-D-glucosyltransferase / alpha-amylase
VATETPNLTIPVDAVAPAASAAEDDPLWYKDAIIYQAHVKSFFDSNNDGIGDFQGVTQKLDYLQNLGITCLWILPFFPSPLKDDGYDIADYRNVHPSYGTLDDFKAFVKVAHERHIKVLIELVVNHTSDQHPWFQRARHAPPGSPEREFYVWSDTDTKFPETRIIFTDTEKSNWTYDPVAKQYYWHRFFSHQPDLNHNNPAVVDAVIEVMKFWLDLGVDALRLDAVPYLCVREGTNNENLPETHAVLKRIRRELDAAYKNRMLLAEANQWPSDVRDYFGDGDECHMAFHFPLMPRMFMALRQEDRHAITEILNQTPDIPETCQWALFLRNHDELTLEMVTDEERDYMYSVYAADPQMRINVGIRRRLAPLVENSRRRIELLNSMLFSMPGTPIVYYGDEIGMGDNIYLGDRNGVRTPMQWSSDRNAGFSRADPARLYAPPIQDPVYGYQSINVEAQERYPFSHLNWTKRLIATRKQHRVFGRGTLEFVPCTNRKVLAYLRRDDKETILCVVNLSRAVQPAELDLRAFGGMIPVEMYGLTEFPRITDGPYFLTLGPYASYWFALQNEPMQMLPKAAAPTDPIAAIVESLPALLMGVDWQNMLDAATRGILERQALAPFLQRQRWFGSKARTIREVRFSDWTALRTGNTPACLSRHRLHRVHRRLERQLFPAARARRRRTGSADAQDVARQRARPRDRCAQGCDRRWAARRRCVRSADGNHRARRRSRVATRCISRNYRNQPPPPPPPPPPGPQPPAPARAAQVDSRRGRSEQQRGVRRRPLRSEAVPTDRADDESRAGDRALPDRARVHEDSGARGRARVSAPRRRRRHAGRRPGTGEASGLGLGVLDRRTAPVLRACVGPGEAVGLARRTRRA